MILTTDDLRGMILAAGKLIEAHEDTLNKLDGMVGDGDHGTGIANGFRAVAEGLNDVATPADVMKITATTLMNRMGGSSGALYGTLFLRAARHVKNEKTLTPALFVGMWQAGMAGVMHRGKSQPGDKTMLDALFPAVEALNQQIEQGLPFAKALAAAAEAAEQGAQATAEMEAKHGRARYVGERAVGHIDAGARSVALMFQALHEYWKAKVNGEA